LAKELVMRRKAIGAAAEDLGAKGFISRFSIGHRLTLCFVGIFVLLLVENGILLRQFHSAHVRVDRRLTGVSLELIAVLNLQSSLQSFNDRLDRVAQSQDAVLLRQESGSLRDMILDSVQDARNAITHLPPEVRPHPTFVPTILAIESALPSQLESLNSLAASGDWSALRLRLANEKRPLDAETSMLVKSITRELSDELGQTVTNIARLERQMVIVLPLTALGTLLIASLLGVMITRSITTPLGNLMEGSSALSRGEFDHLVPISGDDELATLGRVFNDTAGKLRSLYETLQDSNAKLEEAQRITHVGYWEWDLATDCLIWSDETYRIFGLRPQERPMNVDALREMIHPEDRDRVFREKEQTITSGVCYDVEHRIVRPSGEVRVLNSTHAVKKDESGRPTHFYGTVQDITDRKRAEEALQKDEFYLAEGQRLAHMGSWAFDATGFSYWSLGLFQVYGLDPRRKPPTAEEYLALVHPEDRAFMKQGIAKMLDDHLAFDFTKRIVRPDGEIRHIRCVGVPVTQGGTFQGFLGTGVDVTEQERLTEELRRNEYYLSEGQRLAHMGSWAFNPAGFFDYWSEELFRIYGLDPQKGAPTLEQHLATVHPQDRDFIANTIKRMHAERCGCDVKKRIVRADGEQRYVRWVGIPVVEGEALKGFIGTAMDITEQELLTEELERQQAYLAEAQRLTHTGSWAINVRTDEHFWSEEMFRINEIDPRLKPSWSLILDRVHPDDRASLEQRKKMEFTQTGWADSEADLRIVLPDGRTKHLHTIAHPVMDTSGQIVEVVGTTMDVTERKRIEDSLRRSESHLAEAQKLTHTGSWVWRVPDRNAVHLSEEWYRIYGFDPTEGAPAWEKRLERVHPEDRLKWKGTIERAIVEKADYDLEFRILFPNGKVKWIHTVGHPVLSKTGDLEQFVGSSTDVTELKSAEQERERMRQLEADLAHINRVSTLGEMAASLAHEIKQPIAAAITSANSCVEWLAHDPPNLDRARAAAARIDKYGNRAAEIIDRIRSFYKKSSPQRELVDVNRIIHEMLTLLEGDAFRLSVAMRTDLSVELPKIMADPVQLQQVFMNLMLNGIEAMHDSGGELTVKSQLQDGQLQFSVSDTGVGLPTEKMDQIFSAFFTTKPQGSGMGLAISRSIVESHGGQLWASVNSGGGATFHFTLPTEVTEPTLAVFHRT
jgi:PAS domain S-box-containing protein